MNPQLQQLHNAIIYGKLPTLFVDFGIFSVEFTLNHPANLLFSLVDNIEILEKCTIFNGHISGKDIVSKLPKPVFKLLLDMYDEFQQKTTPQLFRYLAEYVEDNESRAQWLLAQAVGISTILPTVDSQLNIFQRAWVIQNAAQDKREHIDTIKQVIEVLKPWLNNELYHYIKDHAANTRENVMFDEDEDALDARIRAAAATSAPKTSLPSLDTIDDIIQIKDNS